MTGRTTGCIVWGVLLGILVLGLWWGVGADSDPRQATVEQRDLVLGVEVTGELEAVNSIELGPPQISRIWSYKISFMAPEGSTVEVGEPVLRFDTSELVRDLPKVRADLEAEQKRLQQRRNEVALQLEEERLALAEAQARLRRLDLEVDVPPEIQAAHELQKARIDYQLVQDEIEARRRLVELLETGGEAELQGLQERTRQAAEEVRRREQEIASMTVRAPRAGSVVYVSDFNGDKKQIGDTAWRMQKVVAIPELDELSGAGAVREAESGRLEPGQPVTLRLDAYPDRPLPGRVERIHRVVKPRSVNDPRKVTRLDIVLEQTAGERMLPGMRFTGTVEVDRIEDALVVPLEAIFPRPEGPVVQVAGWFGTESRRVELGRRNATHVEVLGGVSRGQEVLLR
ncbi:MAG: efflux RND transporter periplasmic adaptor subunit [Acidobacteriota bacterium]|nr:efflux RND transporter periplasmic adaptor subunit [Acidobacteriota bacterium]